MNNATDTSSRQLGLDWVPPLSVLAVALTGLVLSVATQPALHAAGDVILDHDGDGLVDVLEGILGTKANSADTDRDGLSDAEELARNSSPLFIDSRPQSERLSLGMSCYGMDGKLHGLIAVYLPNLNLHAMNFDFGMLVGERLAAIPDSYVLEKASIEILPSSNPLAMVALIDVPFGAEFVHMAGSVTFWASAGSVGSGIISTADVLHLLSIDGMVVMLMLDPTEPPSSTVGMMQNATSSGAGTIYMPLPLSEGDNPVNWVPGEICVQQSSPVGSAGAVLTQEVTSAECHDGWEAACPPSCASSVGTTFTTIDPAVLIGG
jgi:hypothetical protein